MSVPLGLHGEARGPDKNMIAKSVFIPKCNEFIAHWSQCAEDLAPKVLLVRDPEKDITVSLAQFIARRDLLQSRQNTVQDCLNQQLMARSNINSRKVKLLELFNEFNGVLDAFYLNTDFYAVRPLAPSLSDGQEAFSRPLVAAMLLWEDMNVGPAPAGVTLPVTLSDGTVAGGFASLLSALQFAFANEQRKEKDIGRARWRRDQVEIEAYEVMKLYRETVPVKVKQFPELVETMPRLSPLPGHTPDAVNSSAIFVAPNSSKVVYDASTDATLASYQLRGNVGDDYSDQDAVVIATNAPGAPREFITPFGLNQPGAKVAMKVYVILNTDNEAGSAAMFVERPVSLPLAA